MAAIPNSRLIPLSSTRKPSPPPQIPPPHLPNSHKNRFPALKPPSSSAIQPTHFSNPPNFPFPIPNPPSYHDLSPTHLQFSLPLAVLSSPLPNSPNNRFPAPKPSSSSMIQPTHFSNPPNLPTPSPNPPSFHDLNPIHLQFSLPLAVLSFPLPSSAAEAEQAYNKINVEAIVTSIDDFFNQNPFFVAGVTFIWLVVIPLAQEFLKKYKLISAIDAFRKLRDVPSAQLLDIRKKQSIDFMASPSLKILNKSVVQVEFDEADEEGFVKEVLRTFGDPTNTVVCVLDNFDGDSMKVAELLYKNGFKEAYAIVGGLRGKEGWQAIQENYLPPSVHVRPRTKNKKAAKLEVNGERNDEESIGNNLTLASLTEKYHTSTNGSASTAELPPRRPSSPYPNYHDWKPPSSPTPSKPCS